MNVHGIYDTAAFMMTFESRTQYQQYLQREAGVSGSVFGFSAGVKKAWGGSMQASTQQYMAVLDVDIDRWVKTVVLMYCNFSHVLQNKTPIWPKRCKVNEKLKNRWIVNTTSHYFANAFIVVIKKNIKKKKQSNFYILVKVRRETFPSHIRELARTGEYTMSSLHLSWHEFVLFPYGDTTCN